MHELMYKHGWAGATWTPVDINHYPGGEPLMSRPEAIPVKSILLRPTSLESFTAAMFWVDALTMRGNPPIILNLPYVPGARQDRMNSEGDYLFTLKSVAKMINDRNFLEVFVLDPHSDVTCALLNNARAVSAREIIRKHLSYCHGLWDAVVAPDAGAAKRAGDVAQLLQIPVYQAWKTRDIKTGKITGFGMEKPKLPNDRETGHLLVVDDICDGGGTFVGLGGIISTYGFTADLYVTHGIFSKGLDVVLQKYRKIYTTNSIVFEGERNFSYARQYDFQILKEC